jgi:hypothetical protein
MVKPLSLMIQPQFLTLKSFWILDAKRKTASFLVKSPFSMDHLGDPRSSSKAHRFGLIIIPPRRARYSHGLSATSPVVNFFSMAMDWLENLNRKPWLKYVKILSNMKS